MTINGVDGSFSEPAFTVYLTEHQDASDLVPMGYKFAENKPEMCGKRVVRCVQPALRYPSDLANDPTHLLIEVATAEADNQGCSPIQLFRGTTWGRSVGETRIPGVIGRLPVATMAPIDV